MHLGTLRNLFARQARVKLFVVTEDTCLCGMASHPFPGENGLWVDIDECLSHRFGDERVLHQAARYGAILLGAGVRVTRRLQTHRRHLVGRDVPETYFERALAL